MKIAEAKNTSASLQKKRETFFQKGDGVDTPFFERKQNMHPLIQTKLTIGQPNDKYEREADAVADNVVHRMAASDVSEKREINVQTKPLVKAITPLVQTKCASCEQEEKLQKKEEEDIVQESPLELQRKPIFESNAEPSDDESNIQRKCTKCENEEKLQRKEGSSDSQTVSSSIESSLTSSKGSGTPLPDGTRQKMENSFGADFSGVRLHTDGAAVKMNKDLHAQAFTHGSDIYFNSGKGDSNSNLGKHLLAHELTHVLQQEQSFRSIQKLGGEDIDAQCNMVTETPSNVRFHFIVNTSNFVSGEERRLKSTLSSLPTSTKIDVLGMASSDGPVSVNQRLSCERADKVAHIVTSLGLAVNKVSATGGFPGTNGDNDFRAVALNFTTEPEKKCGPDVTDWFINQVNAAKKDPIVLALQARLAGAERVARSGGFSAMAIAEGAVAKKVFNEEAKAGSPTRTADAKSQLTASVPGQREFGRALIAATVPFFGRREALVLAAIKSAALTWKNLVGTGKKYDFKNRTETLKNPVSANCPANCANTITFCPVSVLDCFVKDVPGNLFYSHVGRFVGWSELSLQLGSQFAQLESSAQWDPPEDTQMIHFGFNLPDPLTRADLCSLISSNRSVFDIQNCSNCPEIFSPNIV